MRLLALCLVLVWTECGDDDARGTRAGWTLSRAESREGVVRVRPRAVRLADQSSLTFRLWPTMGDAGGSCDGRLEVVVEGLTAYLDPTAPARSFGGWHRACTDEGCEVPFRVTNQSACTATLAIEAFVFDEERAGPSCEGDLPESSVAIE